MNQAETAPIANMEEKTEVEKPVEGKAVEEKGGKEGKEEKENHDQRRMKKFIMKSYEEKARADFNASRVEMLEAKLKALEGGGGKIASDKPTLAQFDGDVEKFTEALTEYKMNALKSQEVEPDRRAKDIVKAWKVKEAAAKKEIEDYEDVVYGADPMELPGKLVIEAIMDSEHGAEIRYLLAKEPELVEKIESMTEASAIREIGKIEARIESEKRAKMEKGNKEKPKLPNPIKPEKSGAGAHSDDLSAESLFQKFSKGEKIST